ncbi:MAG TPA: hypothetical protein VKB69_12250, partial [Micromonosporaceae bacterium]|nr:hypothetical protein [Micromonosporaceae bacterium]
MGALDAVAARVAAGAAVSFRPSGSSTVPLIRSRTVYLHLVSAVDRSRGRVQISNNRGRVNGWTTP